MIDLAHLRDRIAAHRVVARIVIVRHAGSTPRETGASMLVWGDGQEGTIGGGQLEFQAVVNARRGLAGGNRAFVKRHALGPDLGQCCGGAVTLVTEIWDEAQFQRDVDIAACAASGVFVRRVEGTAAMPDRLRRRLTAGGPDARTPIRAPTRAPAIQIADGWLAEPVSDRRRPVYIYGAGHVGHALAGVLAPLPEFDVHVADTRAAYLAALPPGVRPCPDGTLTQVMGAASPEAMHLIMTPEHSTDLDLCHTVLQRRFAYAGLIGSATKWARFRKRLAALGHGAEAIGRIDCPIGDPDLGKHPQAIAIGVAARLLAGPVTTPQLEEIMT